MPVPGQKRPHRFIQNSSQSQDSSASSKTNPGQGVNIDTTNSNIQGSNFDLSSKRPFIPQQEPTSQQQNHIYHHHQQQQQQQVFVFGSENNIFKFPHDTHTNDDVVNVLCSPSDNINHLNSNNIISIGAISNNNNNNLLNNTSNSRMKKRVHKISISQFKHPVQTDPSYAEQTWKTLQSAFKEINRRNTSNLSYEELYRYAYHMVLHKHGDKLYSGLQDTLTEHLQEVAITINSTSDLMFLKEVKRQWDSYRISLLHIRDILMYMDRTYVFSKKKMNVHDLGVSLFRDVVIREQNVNARLIEALLVNVDRERSGELVDTYVLKSITQLLVDLGNDSQGKNVYSYDFEEKFLMTTSTFYARESKLFLAENTCSDYLKKAENRILEEEDRVQRYLDARTLVRVRDVAQKELIENNINVLVDMENAGLIWMLRNDKLSDLTRMFNLFRTVPSGESILRSKMKEEIITKGKALVADQELLKDPPGMISAILSYKEKYDIILKSAFSTSKPIIDAYDSHHLSFVNPDTDKIADKSFLGCLNEAFESFLNSFSSTAEYISLYVDKALRHDFKGASEDEIENNLDAVMALFRYIQNKDVFERYYKQHLSKRLLSGRTISDDAERSFVLKLKSECGAVYTSKMECMFADIKTSAETNEAFRNLINGTDGPGNIIDLSVTILTTGSWPVTQVPSCILPMEIVSLCKEFETFYTTKHDGRCLTWQTNMGTVDLRAFFGNGMRKNEINCNTYQMCILMMFNKGDTFSYKEIEAETGIPPQELVRNLLSIACGKQRLLTKEPKGREINETDFFHFNEDFSSRLVRVKIQTVAAHKETESEKQETKCRINDDRKPQIDAAIVRIMKSRRVLEHNLLVSEVTNQLKSRFCPDPVEIKKRIESLIEREFLEREMDHRVYRYMA